MRTVQISIGEIIEAMYSELIETYGDKDLALSAAQVVSDELLARFSQRPRPARTPVALPPGVAQLSATIIR